MKKTFLVFGNPDLPDDSLGLQLIPDLKNAFPEIQFQIVDPNELDLLNKNEIFVLDTVQGLKYPRWIEINELARTGNQVTTHDFDASTYLLLLKKIHPNISIKILGIPYGAEKTSILKKTRTLLHEYLLTHAKEDSRNFDKKL